MKEKYRVLCNGLTEGLDVVRGVRKSLFEEVTLELISGSGTGVMEISGGGEKALWKGRWGEERREDRVWERG